eukprot:scaffold201242_cov18-Tisochrysis_lutea.AAC.1
MGVEELCGGEAAEREGQARREQREGERTRGRRAEKGMEATAPSEHPEDWRAARASDGQRAR